MTKDLNFNDWRGATIAGNDPRNWKCGRCDIKFTNYNEWIFHRKIDCPNMNQHEKAYVAPNGSYEATKKGRQCYRCGRYGHYYMSQECHAFKDNKGNDITWGKRKIPSVLNLLFPYPASLPFTTLLIVIMFQSYTQSGTYSG